MPTSLSAVSICNVALSKIGAQAINSLTDQTNPSSIQCNINYGLAYLEVSRAARWNCLVTTQILVQEPQTPLPDSGYPATVTPWEINTSYAADVYLSYGGYIYITNYAYTSTNNFVNDLTTGALTQTNLPTDGTSFPGGNGANYPSGWAFKYALPSDFQLLVGLNDHVGWWGWQGAQGTSQDFEIMGDHLFCNANQAIAKYVKNQPDPSQFDALFTNALTLKLASAIATPLRQDGGRLEQALLAGYEVALRQARTKNGGEQQVRRFNPIQSSLWTAARYRGLPG